VLVAVSCDDDDDAALVETAPIPVGTPAPTVAPMGDTTAGADATAQDEPSDEQTEVAMVDTSFDPADMAVTVGATIVWTNEDAVEHTTTADDGTWDSGLVAPGESFDFTFDEPGTYTYLCEIHPSIMQGTITVETAP
jgi:plastocyanin